MGPQQVTLWAPQANEHLQTAWIVYCSQISYWDDVFGALVKTKEWKKYLDANVIDNDYLNSRDVRKFLESEYADYKLILGELGLAK